MDGTTLLLVTATVTGLYMAWNIGANDVANAMGTTVGSKALSLRGAILIAACFEFSGSLIAGGTVTSTIAAGIIDIGIFREDAWTLALGMTCCLLSAAIWLNVATFFGWPVSTTHTIVGSVFGFGVVAGGFEAVRWSVMNTIVLSWVASPLLGGLLSYAVFTMIRDRILNAMHPLQALRRLAPLLIFPIFTVLTLALALQGLSPLGLEFRTALCAALATGLLSAVIAVPVVHRLSQTRFGANETMAVEQVFSGLQVLTASMVAFAHGSNDVANAVGPLATVFGAIQMGIQDTIEVPMNVLMIGAIGIVIGLSTFGYRVMATIGEEITSLTPSRGFSAEFAASTTILLASMLAIPVSTSHTLVGSVIGVGFARSLGAINTSVVRRIALSWVVTVPFSASLAAILFSLVHSIAG
ncbi:MAG: inorganic phosphate transporter [Myxococcota bacterium]